MPGDWLIIAESLGGGIDSRKEIDLWLLQKEVVGFFKNWYRLLRENYSFGAEAVEETKREVVVLRIFAGCAVF